ncbi:hypothetical protein QC761_507910 [Podospora bellae-mahoneyi]|uniref:Uncharacterized protein n=1 Tax=Podospora bellae-mahoneyi TaxID=2093777 RepID=A0ABR0FGV6_9PEZI|nr:hypothetical protein QC761_507910 [Podospora bellae-mahoneyi]
MDSFLQVRDIIPFPPGDNSSDTLIGNSHLNLTTLEHWNYTLFTNQTLSNGSWCLLAWEPWIADFVMPNGTFINATWCWSPVNGIGERAGTSIGFAVLFGVALVLTIVALNRHGRLYLPVTKRFYPIGRRWQWYWGIIVSATAVVSLFTAMDVDRYYLPELPLILTSFFWFLMQLGTIAQVWEAVRHWGSWMERQFIDPDPYALRDDDRRSKVEFHLPLIFYLFWWLNFFMIIPRNWTPIQHQRYPEQVVNEAEPSATDARFKAAGFLLFVCWCLTVFSLRHSIKHYRPRNRGIINRFVGFIRMTPLRFKLLIPIALVVPAYQELCAWKFEYSPLNLEGNRAAIFAGGYAPALLIMYIQVIFGFINENEDKELKRQRIVRNQQLDQEMGIVKKPGWWARVNGEVVVPGESMRDQLVRNVREIQGNKPRNNGSPASDDVPMSPLSPSAPGMSPAGTNTPPTSPPPLYNGRSERIRQERAMQAVAGVLFPQNRSAEAERRRREQEVMMDGPTLSAAATTNPPPPPYPGATGAREGSVAPSVGSRVSQQPPQQIRSMLDI